MATTDGGGAVERIESLRERYRDLSWVSGAADDGTPPGRRARGGLSASVRDTTRRGTATGPGGASVGRDGRVLVDNPAQNATEDLRSTLNNEEFADISFIFPDGSLLYGHKVLLCARSSVFRRLITEEATPGEPTDRVAVAGGISEKTFLSVLTYFYLAEVDVSVDECCELLGAAAFLGLESLRSRCEGLLEDSISLANVCSIFRTADVYHAVRLRGIALAFITSNFDEVSKSTNFAELDKDLILELVRSR
jgi:BTB/POZ domain/BTB And C-terminal Kelch